MSSRPAVSAIRVALTLSCATGCDMVLGGLGEGTSRTRPAPEEAGTHDAGLGAPCEWPGGHAYRTEIVVENPGAEERGMVVRLAVDTRMPFREGKLRANADDFDLIGADGVRVPYVFDASPIAEAAGLWAKLDLAPGKNRLYAYYGSATSNAPHALGEVFADGIVSNGTFTSGTNSWIANPSAAGRGYALKIEDRKANIVLEATDDPGGPHDIGFCQTVDVPADRPYRLVLDFERTNDDANGAVRIGGLAGKALWSAPDHVGIMRGASTLRLDSGRQFLCLTAERRTRAGIQTVSFRNLRVAPAPVAEPLPYPLSAEQQCVPVKPKGP